MKYIELDGSVSDLRGKKLIEMLVCGTFLQNEVKTTYAHLCAVFGKPTTKGDGYKVDAEWIILTPEGIVTIYNYKDGKNYLGKDGLEVEKITEWHIGGHSNMAVDYIGKALTV